MPTAVVIVPCYNEAERLDAAAFRAFSRDREAITLLFVDDGSTDATRERLNELAAGSDGRMRVLGLDENGGKAEAVRRGVLAARAMSPDYVGFWDADLATPLQDIPSFIEILEARPDLVTVFGSRVNLLGRSVRRKLMRHYIGRVFATAATAVLRVPIYDTQCGAKLFRATEEVYALFEDPFISRWIFDVEIIARLARARRENAAIPVDRVIYEHPLMVWHDVKGSKIRSKDFLVVGMDLLRIHGRYMRR